jgi:proteasome assembly chaperone (PAC2) family protein
MDDPRLGHQLHEELPSLNEPVLVTMLTGWIDASGSAANALAAIESQCAVRTLATFDGDLYIDYRARRPTMELREGVNERVVWPEIELHVARTTSGRDLLTLTGPEPDSAWRHFARDVGDLAVALGVRQAIFLGAYPFAAPHTRAARLSCSSPSAELVASVPFLKNSVDVPAGMGAVLEHALHDRGVAAIGLWAQVPHYLGTMTYPAASIALLDGLRQLTGVDIDTSALQGESTIQRERVDQLVAANPEHQVMVQQLETLYDEAMAAGEELGASPLDSADMPTGDELAAELERFLRDQSN